jgi:hypothetical protein
MIPISMRISRKQWRGKTWEPAGPQALWAAPRHLRWAARIASKLGRRAPWRGLHSEAMTLAHPLRTRVLRLQTLFHRFHSQTRLLHSPERKQNATQAVERQPDRSRSLLPAPPAVVERNLPVLSFVREIVQHSAPEVSCRNIIQRNRTVEFVERVVAPRLSRTMHAVSSPETSLASMPSGRATIQPTRQPSQSDSAATLPDRVLRNHRRVEARPFLRARDAAPQILPSAVPEEPAVIHRTPARRRVRQFDSPTEPAPRQHIAPQAPHIDVAQITDAVLQQLDRRLIAARERMGRI